VAYWPSAFITMQNWASGQSTVVPIPAYCSGAGMTWWGADHDDPFQVRTAPPASAAMQNELVGQLMLSRPPRGSIVSIGDHAAAPAR
jgi:hypothetical protein